MHLLNIATLLSSQALLALSQVEPIPNVGCDKLSSPALLLTLPAFTFSVTRDDSPSSPSPYTLAAIEFLIAGDTYPTSLVNFPIPVPFDTSLAVKSGAVDLTPAEYFTADRYFRGPATPPSGLMPPPIPPFTNYSFDIDDDLEVGPFPRTKGGYLRLERYIVCDGVVYVAKGERGIEMLCTFTPGDSWDSTERLSCGAVEVSPVLITGPFEVFVNGSGHE